MKKLKDLDHKLNQVILQNYIKKDLDLLLQKSYKRYVDNNKRKELIIVRLMVVNQIRNSKIKIFMIKIDLNKENMMIDSEDIALQKDLIDLVVHRQEILIEKEDLIITDIMMKVILQVGDLMKDKILEIEDIEIKILNHLVIEEMEENIIKEAE